MLWATDARIRRRTLRRHTTMLSCSGRHALGCVRIQKWISFLQKAKSDKASYQIDTEEHFFPVELAYNIRAPTEERATQKHHRYQTRRVEEKRHGRGRSQTKAEGILEGSKITGYEIEPLGCTWFTKLRASRSIQHRCQVYQYWIREDKLERNPKDESKAT